MSANDTISNSPTASNISSPETPILSFPLPAMPSPAISISSTRLEPERPVIIGIYGLPASGKTHLINFLRENLDSSEFTFYEGSEVIADLAGGLGIFQQLHRGGKISLREQAIRKIARECAESGKAAVVAGHYMFWEEGQDPDYVCTEDDLEIFTHILYLNVPPRVLQKRRLRDLPRDRPKTTQAYLHRWQKAEKAGLRELCRRHGILFSLVRPQSVPVHEVELLRDFKEHNEDYNLARAIQRLDEILFDGTDEPDTVLALDADRTLAEEDTGAMFWEQMPETRRPGRESEPLSSLFGSPLGHSYAAFRQAMLYYEEAANDEDFDARCAEVASKVTMHPEFETLLRRVAGESSVGAVLITCGLGLVWEKVLEKYNLSDVKVIGGGRIADGFVVTPEVKTALVEHLRDTHRAFVWAFGDSPLDLGMLQAATEAIIIVGERERRSRTMDAELLDAIDNSGLRARQVLLPPTSSPRLDTERLHIVELSDPELLESMFNKRHLEEDRIAHGTYTNAGKLLATPMRDASLSGAALREAHRKAGWYLATHYVTEMVGLEQNGTPHVQGGTTTGYRLDDEEKTTIVALMRGGEPMALGVSEAFALAMFVHAKVPEDLKIEHFKGQHTVLLVDSVVNSGQSVMEFLPYIREIHPGIRIVIVAGVVQATTLIRGVFANALRDDPNLGIVALRMSENQYTGSGTTDAGHRLFNTTHLP